jgi:hypothetical protein
VERRQNTEKRVGKTAWQLPRKGRSMETYGRCLLFCVSVLGSSVGLEGSVGGGAVCEKRKKKKRWVSNGGYDVGNASSSPRLNEDYRTYQRRRRGHQWKFRTQP